MKTFTHRGSVIEYIEVVESDITLVNRLTHEVPSCTLDEMPAQTRKLLLEMEYLLLYRRGLTYEYTLLWDGEDNAQAHLCGLLDVEK